MRACYQGCCSGHLVLLEPLKSTGNTSDRTQRMGGLEHLSVSSSHCWLGPALGTCQLSLWGQLWGLTGRWGHDTGRPEPCAQAERLRQEPSLSSVGSSGSGQRAAGVTTRLQPFEACLKKHAVEPDKWPPIPKGNLHQMQ